MPKRKKTRSVAIRKREQLRLLYCSSYMTVNGIPRLSLDDLVMADGSNGVRLPVHKKERRVSLYNSKPATCFPSPSLLACSFDNELVSEVGKAIANEALDNGVNMLLAPSVNIKRNPLNGRSFEYYSEDPLLAGKLGAAFINGVQSQNVGATLKHFACNNQESYRMLNDSIIDKRALNEIYLKPFEIAIKESNPYALMAAYNKVNGVYMSRNSELLFGLVRESWGYDGIIMSDWGGCEDYIYDHNKGLDLELSNAYNRYSTLSSHYNSGSLHRENVRASAHRVAEVMKKVSRRGPYKRNFTYEDHHELCKKAAQNSTVLLENDGILPLRTFNNVCVIGALASDSRYQGAGSNTVCPKNPVSLLQAIRKRNVSKLEIPYESGYELDRTPYNPTFALDAIDLASRCKTVILVLGLLDTDEGENFDRKNLQLPDCQIKLFDSIYQVNQNIIVILNTGAPVELPFAKKARAILLPYLPGEGGFEGVASILLGDVSPSGRLAESWPLHLSDVASFGFYPGSETQSVYRESIYVGYRYYESANKKVLYPFGYGLSYTKFKYTEFTASKANIDSENPFTVSVTVTNTGKVSGGHVIQLYLEPKNNKVFKAKRSLIAYKKVFLEAGKAVKVNFTLDKNVFSHYNIESKAFCIEDGQYDICLCANSSTVIGKIAFKVKGEIFLSSRNVYPVYYDLGKNGFLRYENDFENLLGHSVFIARDPKSRPYTMNCTIEDLSRLWVGKKINRRLAQTYKGAFRDGIEKMSYYAMVQTPLRTISLYLKNHRLAYVICDLANKKYFTAVFHFLFGVGARRDRS